MVRMMPYHSSALAAVVIGLLTNISFPLLAAIICGLVVAVATFAIVVPRRARLGTVFTRRGGEKAVLTYAEALRWADALTSVSLFACVVDVDNLRGLNALHGRREGDAILSAFRQHLTSKVERNGVVAHIGGDEFAILISDLDVDTATEWAQSLWSALRVTHTTSNGDTIAVSASIGTAWTPPPASAEDAIGRAEAALYGQKESGRSGISHVVPPVKLSLGDDVALATSLRSALDAHNGLWMAYQPIVALPEGRVVAAEALIRWNHPSRGPIGPSQLIAIAERQGMVREIGRFAITEATRSLARWREMGSVGEDFELTVNASALELQDAAYPHFVFRALDSLSIPASALCIEVTETALMTDPEQALAVLSMLSDRGVRIAVDDFGTGYSSLAYLQRFHVDKIKIDREFVSRTPENHTTRGLVAAISVMARSLGIRDVIAEGIETSVQAQLAGELGCTMGQGYFFGAPRHACPMPANAEQSR